MRISQVRSALYRTARGLGDVNAVRRGRVPQRIVRRSAGKLASRLFRVLGLALAVVLVVGGCSKDHTYYADCTAAQKAGAAPLHRGEPGYRAELDRNGDGIA